MLKLYNSLDKKTEEVRPMHDGEIGMYACGPTVYDFTHIGHGRKYVNDDVLRRTLAVLEGYKVKMVENITDVGHLTSDADTGEDKLEKGAKKEGKTVWEVAAMYTDYFHQVMGQLNVLPPTIECKATDHIDAQIALIKKILKNGYGYETAEAVYFDVTKFADYNKLFGQSLSDKKVGVREEVETETHKKHPQDFALWLKRKGKYAGHIMYWHSPWGDGFPGWHVECSAMSMEYLGDQFDIHTGGEDHLSIHHPNEIAQSEAATGKKPFVHYWFHSAFLMVNGQKMSKSLDNYLRVEDVVAKGFSPLALRYYFLTTHYRKQMNFTWEGMTAAQNAYDKLNDAVARLKGEIAMHGYSDEGKEYYQRFTEAMEDDLNTPVALGVIWELMKSSLTDQAKKNLMGVFDEVLGLELGQVSREKGEVPEEIKELMAKRSAAKEKKDFSEADKIRKKIEDKGFVVSDTRDGSVVERA